MRLPSVSFAGYRISVKKHFSERDERLDLISSSGKDMLKICNLHLTMLQQKYHNDEEGQSLLKVTRRDEAGRVLSGFVETGEYGAELKLVDADTLVEERISDRKAVTRPFFFYFDIPEGATSGILLLQRTATFGISGFHIQHLHAVFREQLVDHTLYINPFMPAEVMRQILRNGVAKELIFRHVKPRADVGDQSSYGNEEKNFSVEMKIVANRNTVLPRDWLGRDDHRATVTGIVEELPEEEQRMVRSISPNQVKAVIRSGGAAKTFDIVNMSSSRAFYDISSRVDRTVDGLPTYESLISAAQDYVGDLRLSLQGTQ